MESENRKGSEKQFLGNKREALQLRDNFNFRRILSGKVFGLYEQISSDFINLLSFDWEDEKLLKAKINLCKIIFLTK